MNWWKIALASDFFYALSSLRPKMAVVAQNIYNEWIEDDYATGGICDEIANEIGGIISMNLKGVEVVEGGQDGDDHAWIIAHNGVEAYGVDIPYNLYESGGGYNWKKIPKVIFSPENIEIWKLDIDPNELV